MTRKNFARSTMGLLLLLLPNGRAKQGDGCEEAMRP